MRVIALLRGLMVAPARGATAGPGEGRRGAKTAGATPTTGCVTPPGGVGVERRREIPLLVAPSLRFGGAPAERGENPPISPRGTRSWSFRNPVDHISLQYAPCMKTELYSMRMAEDRVYRGTALPVLESTRVRHWRENNLSRYKINCQ